MNIELIAILMAIVAAAIALGTAMLASIRGVRHEVRDLRGEMKAMETGLRGDVTTLDSSLRRELKATESSLRDEMQAGFKELTSRVLNLGDRLSKVEGIIEGVFWGARNQHADKPGEGAA